jgi:hypothetical protein
MVRSSIRLCGYCAHANELCTMVRCSIIWRGHDGIQASRTRERQSDRFSTLCGATPTAGRGSCSVGGGSPWSECDESGTANVDRGGVSGCEGYAENKGDWKRSRHAPGCHCAGQAGAVDYSPSKLVHRESVCLKAASDQFLDRCEVPVWQVLESAFTVGQGFVGGLERFNHGQ